MPRDEATLLDILQAARLALEFKGAMGREELFEDRKIQSSILYQLVIVGEGVRRLSSDFRAQHGELPWKEIAGMRDHLVHAYDAVDLDEVWNTLSHDVPKLITWLEGRESPQPQDPPPESDDGA
jgi:uncharacterized protein with HEPN domain